MAENIASHVLRCLAAFRPLLEPQSTTATPQKKPLEPKILTVLTDEFSRFKVWSGTIGAHKTGSSSLDYRLRDASHIRDQVLNLVIDLISMLSDVIAITAGEITPWDELDEDEDEADLDNESDEDSPKTELEQIATDIVDVVNGLLRLSVDIKNPAPHPRFLETKLTDKTYFEPFDIQHVSSKFNNIDPWLAERLGKSISRRRQYFKYRETHHEKLSAGLETALLGQEVEVHQKAEPKDSETIASSIPLAMKDSTIMTIAQPAFIKDDQSDAGISHTSYATSAAASGNLKIPPLPDQAYKGPFQCPFCYTMIVARDRNAWKKHVYGDLKPYTCLVEDCIAPERGFGRRHEWMEHVQQNHWHTYSCPFGSCNTPLKSMSECKAHFKTHQSSESTQSGEIEAYIKLAKRPLDITAGIPCPLCHETITSAKQYQSHVGRHQEQLSLFALPSADNEDRSDDDQDSNTASARSRSDASIKSVTRISSGIPLSEIDEDEQEALRDQEELHEYEEYRQAMEEEAEIDERKQGALREEYEETRQLEEHRLVAEKEESRTVGFCHTCKKEEYSSDGTDECAVCGSKLKIITPEGKRDMNHDNSAEKGRVDSQARSEMAEGPISGGERGQLKQEIGKRAEEEADVGEYHLGIRTAEAERDTHFHEGCENPTPIEGGTWFIMERLPGMTVCGNCFAEVVLPLLEEGKGGNGAREIPKHFLRRPRRISGPANCRLHSERMRAVFRLASEHDDWDLLEWKVLGRNREVGVGVKEADVARRRSEREKYLKEEEEKRSRGKYSDGVYMIKQEIDRIKRQAEDSIGTLRHKIRQLKRLEEERNRVINEEAERKLEAAKGLEIPPRPTTASPEDVVDPIELLQGREEMLPALPPKPTEQDPASLKLEVEAEVSQKAQKDSEVAEQQKAFETDNKRDSEQEPDIAAPSNSLYATTNTIGGDTTTNPSLTESFSPSPPIPYAPPSPSAAGQALVTNDLSDGSHMETGVSGTHPSPENSNQEDSDGKNDKDDKRISEQDPYIRFKDVVGRKFRFPLHICNTWQAMEELIQQAFLEMEVIGPHVQEGHYDLIGPDGEIILPSEWERVVKHDFPVTMHMWQLDKHPLRLPINLLAGGSKNRGDNSSSSSDNVTASADVRTEVHGQGVTKPKELEQKGRAEKEKTGASNSDLMFIDFDDQVYHGYNPPSQPPANAEATDTALDYEIDLTDEEEGNQLPRQSAPTATFSPVPQQMAPVSQPNIQPTAQVWVCKALEDPLLAFQATKYPNGVVWDVCGYCGGGLARRLSKVEPEVLSLPPSLPITLVPKDHDDSSASTTELELPMVATRREERLLNHLRLAHNFGKCDPGKKFSDPKDFRQHLVKVHRAAPGKWLEVIEFLMGV